MCHIFHFGELAILLLGFWATHGSLPGAWKIFLHLVGIETSAQKKRKPHTNLEQKKWKMTPSLPCQ